MNTEKDIVPSTGEDIAFWACLTIANVWIAAESMLMPSVWLTLCIFIRWPYWWRLLRDRNKSI